MITIFLAVVTIIVFLCLVLLTAVHPVKSSYTHAELKRRSKHSDISLLELDRYELYPALVTLLRSLRALFLVVLTSLLIGVFGWFVGILAALVTAFLYPTIARMRLAKQAGGRLYAAVEARLLDFVARFEGFFRGLREPSVLIKDAPRRLHSREELAEVIAESKEVIGEKERLLLASALAFPDKTVAAIMTPRSVIDSIKRTEFLGPLVLDELHALGHSRLPVIAEDLDHIVGILHLRDLLSLDVKHSTTVEDAMEKKVYYIRHDDTLEHALAAFIKTRHHLFVVINEQRETVGLLSLEDVTEALIGRRIVDEDDVHADLRAVAARKGKESNNLSAEHVDI